MFIKSYLWLGSIMISVHSRNILELSKNQDLPSRELQNVMIHFNTDGFTADLNRSRPECSHFAAKIKFDTLLLKPAVSGVQLDSIC